MTILLGLLSLAIGGLGLSFAGFHKRRTYLRWSLILLGSGSTALGLGLLYEAGGLGLAIGVPVGALILLPPVIVLVHLAWSAIQFVDSLDKDPMVRPRPPLNLDALQQSLAEPKDQPTRQRSSEGRRIRRSTARQRLKQIEFLTGH
jgi:hypothetical protein